jgi:protein-disulfide isomerase
VATNSKRPARYDLKKQDRRRNLFVQLGLTAIVVIFAVGLVLYIVLSHDKKAAAGELKSVRVASSKVMLKENSSEPKAVVGLYEDFLCPHCGQFEQQFGPTINQLIDSGAIAADYTMVAILDSPQNQDYSSRAGAAAYCVADENNEAFRRFHAALFAQQPEETARNYPDNAQLIEIARQAGVSGGVPDCVNSGKYVKMVQGMAGAAKINATPTVRINGEDYKFTTPQALVDKIKSIVGDSPAVQPAAPPAPNPTPGQQAPNPAPGPAPAPAPAPAR